MKLFITNLKKRSAEKSISWEQRCITAPTSSSELPYFQAKKERAK